MALPHPSARDGAPMTRRRQSEPAHTRLRWPRWVRARQVALVVMVALVSVPLTSTVTAEAGTRSDRQQDGSVLGVYTGPGPKGVSGASAFEAWSGAQVGRVEDFLPSSTWQQMTNIGWLLDPYTGSGRQLELSVPMVPDEAGASLDGCAAGDDDPYWTSIASSVVAAGLPDTVIRPGWEMNGTWFKWSAAGHVAAYVGCFRHLVDAMRSVPGQQFTFTFNPNVGTQAVAGELAWPGDAYVDDVSVDVYDLSWQWYPAPAGVSLAQARTNVWEEIRRGAHGLDFWAGFARDHAKTFGLGEWAVAWRSDGHGGGDDVAFVDRIFDYITDPANDVSYAVYFNSPDSLVYKHDLIRPDTAFPLASAQFRARASVLAGPTPAAADRPMVRGTGRPRVHGELTVGATLRATPGRWSPRPTALRYRWLRDSTVIRRATSPVHRVTRADLGHRLQVEVVASRQGFRSATQTSRPRGVVTSRRARPPSRGPGGAA